MPTARPILEFIERLTPDFLMAPVFSPIRALGFDLAHPLVLLIALGFLVCFWSWVLRTVWCVVGRRLGLYNPVQYHLFPRLPWRYAARVFFWLRDFYRHLLMGKRQTAGWAGFLESLDMLYKPGKIMLGRFSTFKIGWFMPVGIDPDSHLMLVAETGSGKSTSLASILSLHQGNAFVIDPKPQLAPILARRCGDGGSGVFGKKRKVAVLDPKGRVNGHPCACWNPFDEIRSAVERRGEDAAVGVAFKLAEALIKQDSETQPFFANAAREFVQALVLHIHTTEPEDSRNLVKLRKYLTVGDDAAPKREDGRQVSPRSWLLFKMIENKAYDGIIADAAAAIRDSSENTQGNVMRTATVQTKWMDLPEIRNISRCSDFTLSELKTGKLTLFVCAPLSDVQETLSAWFRLLTALAIWVHEDILEKPDHPTLFIVDELPSLGYIDSIATTPATMRSYGVRFIGITQNLEVLRGTYPDHWSTMLSSASAVMWMGVRATEDLEYIRNRLGARTRWQKMKTPKGVDDRIERTERPLAYEQQIKDFLKPKPTCSSNVLVDLAGKRFLRLKTPHYFQELPVYYYDPDPNEAPETGLRQWSRRKFQFVERVRRRCDAYGEVLDEAANGVLNGVVEQWGKSVFAVAWVVVAVCLMIFDVTRSDHVLTTRPGSVWLMPGQWMLQAVLVAIISVPTFVIVVAIPSAMIVVFRHVLWCGFRDVLQGSDDKPIRVPRYRRHWLLSPRVAERREYLVDRVMVGVFDSRPILVWIVFLGIALSGVSAGLLVFSHKEPDDSWLEFAAGGVAVGLIGSIALLVLLAFATGGILHLWFQRQAVRDTLNRVRSPRRYVN